MTYISCFSDFAFYFYYYFMENCHTWIIISMWQNDLHTNTSRSVWPILYGLMIKMLQYKMYAAGELRCPTTALVYKVKLGFTGYTLFFLFMLKNIDCGYSLEPPHLDCGYLLEPPQWDSSKEYPQCMFWAEIWIIEFLSENFHFLVVKFSVYLNRFVINGKINI